MTVPATPVDFSSGVRPAAQWFRSVAFLLEPDRGGTDFAVPAAHLSDWLVRFDGWYKAAVGVSAGRGLHLLYHRDVSLIGADILSCLPRIRLLGAVAVSRGFGLTVTLPIEDAATRVTELRALVNLPGVTTVGLTIEASGLPADKDALSDALDEIVRARAHIVFVGSYPRIRALGLFDHPCVAGTQVTVHPNANAPPAGNGLRRPEQPVMPCFGRLRLHVDPGGDIYPCLGLLGVESARLGHVDDPLEETVLGGRPYSLDVSALAMRGPTLTEPEPEARQTGLPWACERHRLELSNSVPTAQAATRLR